MPNDIQNLVHFVGDESTIEQVRNFIKGKELVFDFNTVIPMPKELGINRDNWLRPLDVPNFRDVSFFDNINSLKGYIEKITERRRKETITNFLQGIDNYLTYGFATCHGWSVNNWGTNRNAYSQEDSRNTSDTIYFETAWSAPMPVLVELSKKFPTINVEFAYAEECCGVNTGFGVLKGGEFLELVEPDNYTEEAYNIFFRLYPKKIDLYELVDGKYIYKDEEEEENVVC